jgi:hypothetical protein
LGFINGYPIQAKPVLGIGLEELNIDPTPSEEELLKALNYDHKLLYGDKRTTAKADAPGFVPAHVAFDKVVLKR